MNKSQSQNKSRRIASARIILNQSRNNNFASPTKNEQTFAEYSKNSGAEFVMRTLSKGTIYHDNQNKDFKSIKSMALHNIEKKTLFNDDEKPNEKKIKSQKFNNFRYDNIIKGDDQNNKKRNNIKGEKYVLITNNESMLENGKSININKYAEDKKEDLKIESEKNTEIKDEEKQNQNESNENNIYKGKFTEIKLFSNIKEQNKMKTNDIKGEEIIEENKNSEVDNSSEYLSMINTGLIVEKSLGINNNSIKESQNNQSNSMSQSNQDFISTNFEGESQNNINQFLYNNNLINNNFYNNNNNQFNYYGNYGLSQEFINGIKNNIPFMFGNFKVYGIVSYNSNFT